MRLYVFARHAQSIANVQRLINSDPDDVVELSPEGRRQAACLRWQLHHLRFDRVVCSRFLRTQQTAEIALAHRATAIEIESDFAAQDRIEAARSQMTKCPISGGDELGAHCGTSP